MLHHHKGFFDQRAQQVDHVVGRERVRAANGFRGAKIEAAGKDTQSVEENLFLLLQQIVGPAHQRAQCLLPLQRDAAATGQQLEPIVKARIDLANRQRPHSGRGQLQCQGYTVESGTEVGDRRCVALSQRKARLLQTRPLNKQLHRLRAQQALHSRYGQAPSTAERDRPALRESSSLRGWSPECASAARHAAAHPQDSRTPPQGARSCRSRTEACDP